MSLRIKYRVVFLTAATIFIYFLASHFRKQNIWAEKTSYLPQEEDLFQNETAPSRIHDNVLSSSTKYTSSKTVTDLYAANNQPSRNDLFTQNKYNNQFDAVQEKASYDKTQSSIKMPSNKEKLQTKDKKDAETHFANTISTHNVIEAKNKESSETILEEDDDADGESENNEVPIEEEEEQVAIETKNQTIDTSKRPPQQLNDLKDQDDGESTFEIASGMNIQEPNGNILLSESIQSQKAHGSIPPLTKPSSHFASPSPSGEAIKDVSFDNINDKIKSNSSLVNDISEGASVEMTQQKQGNDTCSYRLNIDNKKSKRKAKCQLYSNYMNTCNEAKKYYNKKKYQKIPKCKNKRYPPICHFNTSVNTGDSETFNLVCNDDICGNTQITLAVMNSGTGKMNYIALENTTALKEMFEHDFTYLKMNPDADFVFLSCRKDKKNKIHQLLQLPPKVSTYKPSSQEKRPKLNVNVFVIDSLSRQHFYRILPNTVKALTSISTDKESKTQVLDFEGFQSLAPFTYVNLQAFLSGSVFFDSISNRKYNFEKLFKIFKDAGYETMLQEDTCWYDAWGSLLTGNRKLNSKSEVDYQEIWNEVQNLTKSYGVDSVGLTHMSCEVLKLYGSTNLYNSEKMVCLNGKILSSYFIDYIATVLHSRSKIKNSKPLLSYTHINFAHEFTGMRLKAIDKHLSKFIQYLGTSDDTISILWSDHGGKTNKYSMDTLTGRFEVYDPFLFMILPKTFSSIVGETRFNALIDNQNALTSVVNLRDMLFDVLDEVSVTSNNNHQDKQGSLMSPFPHERVDCQDLPGRKYSLCKCINKISFLSMDDHVYKQFLTWLGEFSAGYLNNKLTLLQNHSPTHRCLRLTVNSIKNIIAKDSGTGTIYVFDLVVLTDQHKEELFNFHVFFNTKRNESLDMLQVEHWQRISLYNKYTTCKDPTVSLEMCVCSHKKQSYQTKHDLTEYKQFGVNGSTKPVSNSRCLFLITRKHSSVATFEIANLCDEKMNVVFSTPVLYNWEVAEGLPKTISAFPSTINFINTFYKVTENTEEIQPLIEIKKNNK